MYSYVLTITVSEANVLEKHEAHHTTKPPNPHLLHPLRRTESVLSIDSSLVPHSTHSEQILPSSAGRIFQSMKSGSQCEALSHPHHSKQISSPDTSSNPFKSKIVSHAQVLLEVSLCMQNGWPSGTEKKSTAYSALSWACTLAKSKEWPKLELNQDNVCMITNYSLNYRSQLKTFIIEHIGYWGVIPSEEECKNQNMTPDDVTPILVSTLRHCGQMTSSTMAKMGICNHPGLTTMLSIMLLLSGVTAPMVLLVSSPSILVLSFHYRLSHSSPC